MFKEVEASKNRRVTKDNAPVQTVMEQNQTHQGLLPDLIYDLHAKPKRMNAIFHYLMLPM